MSASGAKGEIHHGRELPWRYRRPVRGRDHASGNIAIVAILRDELPFLDEWLAYHRLLGVDHFFLYDDDPALPLPNFTQPHRDYVTVIPWYNRHGDFPGINRQTKAYLHALPALRGRFRWVAFLDVDEFILLRRHDTISVFLADFEPFHAVTLCWHVFGHNGFFDDPPGLITSNLTRRMAIPGTRYKTINRPEAIVDIQSAHQCVLIPGAWRVDPNQQTFREEVYPGKSDVACINHYFCRSFQHWMRRPTRGSVIDDVQGRYPDSRWRHDRDYACAASWNSWPSCTMNSSMNPCCFQQPIESFLKQRGIVGIRHG